MKPHRALVPFLLLALPAFAQEVRLPQLPVESYRLDNGLKVVLHRDTTVPRVTVCVAYHVGSKDERQGRTGFAHFFEHMMFRGTKNVPNYDIPLQEAGAQSNAETSEDLTIYYETVPSHWLERALYLEAERLAYLPTALDQEKFDTEREVVKNERRQSVDNVPYGLAEEVLLSNVFPAGHPYSWSVIGSMADLNKATLDDLRRFFAEFYHPGNACLTLVGDFDPQQAKALIDRYFGPLKAGGKRRQVVAENETAKAQRLERSDKVQFDRVYWAWPSVAEGHADAPALDMLAAVLSSGEASRLYRALIRDRYLAADVDATNDSKEIAGLFTIDATVAEGETVDAVEAELTKQLARIQAGPPDASELARARAKLETAFLASLTPPLHRAKVLASSFVQYDDPDRYRKDFERFFRVQPADVTRVARKYLTPEKLILVIEPAEGEPKNPPIVAGPKVADAQQTEPTARVPSGNLAWSQLPGPARPGAFHAPKIERRTLSNGLDVWIARRTTVPLVQAQLLVPFGTADDPEGKSGRAALASATFDKGTTRLDSADFTEALEELGAAVGVGGGLDTTSFSFTTLARTLEPMLRLFGELLTSPRFDTDDFQREMELHLAKLQQGPDDVNWIASRAFRALLYGKDHPYGNPADGYLETVTTLTIDDLKEAHKRFVRPKGSHLIVVGDVDPDALVKLLETSLAEWTGEAPAPSPRPEPNTKPGPGVAYLVDKPGAVQSVLAIGRRWLGRNDPRYFATLIGNRVLGGDFLSRLNQNLREKHGFTYGAGSTFSFRRTGSVWMASAQVRADATAPALRELLGELDGVAKDRPFTHEELAVAQDSELQSYPERFEAPGTLLAVIREMVEYHLPPDYLETFLEKLGGVGPREAIQAMGDVVKDEDRLVLIVGDAKSVRPAIEGLKRFKELRPVSPDGLLIEEK
jgi:zinc protease